MGKVSSLGWAASTVFNVSGWHLGVQCNTAETNALVRRLLPGHVVEDQRLEPNYSLAIAPQAKTARVRGLNLLFRSSRTWARTSDARRAVSALVTNLSSHVEDRSVSSVRIRATAVVSEGGAVIVPAYSRDVFDVARSDRRLASSGYGLIDAPLVSIAADTGELLVDASLLDVDWNVLDELGSSLPQSPRPVAAGRYKVRGWMFFRTSQDADQLSRGVGVVRAFKAILNPHVLPGQQLLESVARSFEDAAVATVPRSLEQWMARLSAMLA